MFDFEKRISQGEADTDCRQALTLVFIENQAVGEIYEPESGFNRGTAFPALDKPWCPGGEWK
ncbi:MAG: spore coat associated protein CotJA [Clostridia bacterium]|nr:spore coat associated protein CotJA [Clostridia bacterium]